MKWLKKYYEDVCRGIKEILAGREKDQLSLAGYCKRGIGD